ncbi:FUSC family protein [Aromatoleum diolicum]|uniref:FUSC family protein n=1 Tax=Aromatoleum diolicum TaxID=75796 RepID=A0ABX1QDH6_9RHOO|nr:FUSC family protein [Aromatoleum diolicum]NMG75552.1 hypothetical protein [Aromatoleum diolicum]
MNSPASVPTFLGFDWPLARKALALALAAWLSFAIAAALHVHNAYWAAMPVWVLTQASRGLVVERALYRIVGTLIGAGVGFALMHIPTSPYVQLLVLAVWIAVNAGLTHVLRGVLGYAALLAGMTAAVVVIPSVLMPSDSIDIAMARVLCTLIGVVVSTLVLAALTPESPLSDFYAQIRAVSAEAVAYAARVLREGMSEHHGKEERRILGLISKLDASARLTSAGSVAGYRRLGDVDLLIIGSLTTMAGAQAIRNKSIPCDAVLLDQLDRIAAHLRSAWDSPMAEDERRIDTRQDADLLRLKGAIWQILDADVALNRPDAVSGPSVAPRLRQAWLAPHREWRLAWRAGTLAGGASFAAALPGLWWPWPPLQLAALGVSIFVMVLGSLPLPQLIAPKLLTGVVAGVVAAVFYRLAVQPEIATTTGLLLTIAPFLLVGGFVRVHPQTAIPAVDANMCFLLASQAGMPATDDVGRILGDSAALILPAVVLAGGFILLPRRAERQAVDAAAMIRRDLLRIVEFGANTNPVDWHARGARQILRLTLHLGRAEGLGERWPEGLLATLNVGQSLIDMQRLGMPDAVKALLVGILKQQMLPQQTAQALLALADAADDDTHKLAIRSLAGMLVRAADLLNFGVPARPDNRE